jgi:hypothetical protein
MPRVAVNVTVPAGPLGIALHAKEGGGAFIRNAVESGYLDAIDAAVLEGADVLEINGIPCSKVDQQLIAELLIDSDDEPRVLRVLPLRNEEREGSEKGLLSGRSSPLHAQDLESTLEKPGNTLGVGWFVDPYTGRSGSCRTHTAVA